MRGVRESTQRLAAELARSRLQGTALRKPSQRSRTIGDPDVMHPRRLCSANSGTVAQGLGLQEYHDKHGHQLPVLRDLKGSFYVRDERDGILLLWLHADAV